MKKKVLKNHSGRRLESRVFLPYLGSLIHAVIAYIGGGIITFVLIVGAVEMRSVLGILFLSIIGVIIWYLVFFIPYVLPAVQLLWDISRNTFEKCEIQYRNSLVLRYNRCYKKVDVQEGKTRRIIEPFLEVCCRKKDNTYTNLFSARYHGMVPGDIYTVTYGKYSKVLISILSEDGEKLRDDLSNIE
jgi:hypothetical protein